ncbi:MAG TPA: cytochrome c [Gammaproteobacteria bacterium]|nr:cytochrome c [Gammaproteobacteria bacterium]
MMASGPARRRETARTRAIAVGLALGLSLELAAAISAADESAPRPDAADAVERGHYVLYAAGCIACHTAEDENAKPLAGGRALKTDFGTFRPPNITPDSETGIGGWTEEQFAQALTRGLSPSGDPLYPAFPYTSYAGMRKEDVSDLFAYLRSIEPVHNEVPDHDLKFPYSIRSGLRVWQKLYFDPKPFMPDASKPDAWNRGAYLVNHESHCGECHTPRNFLGAMQEDKRLMGGKGAEGDKIPNITRGKGGISNWSKNALLEFLKTGFLPNGDVVGGSMYDVIMDSTSHLTDADREAIATYLMDLPAAD